jgi:pilus assembly protein CpaF
VDPGDRAHALDLLARELRERLLREVEGDGERADAHERIRALVDREAGALAAAERAELTARIAERSFGLGPLEPLLRDPVVEEIMVSGTAPVWIEREGRLEPTTVRFASEAQLRHAIERILAPLGRRVDESEPLCDGRLPDGSRVNVVLPPLALDGPALTIRRFRARGFSADDLVAAGTLPAPLADFLARAVRSRCTILVCGGTGSGKTTTLNALSGFIPPGERVVTIEDSAELRLRRPHVIRLEARPPNVEGRGEVTIRRLVRNALRMRPDRIVVGEVRGAEALDMLTALTTGHDGSLSTIHAGDAAEALRRLETLALMAGLGLPHAAIREQVADAIDLVVVQARGSDGARRVVGVSEVVRVAGGAGVRELYALRGGRPCWRAPLGDSLAGRLAAAAAPAAPPRGSGAAAEARGAEAPARGLDTAAEGGG